MSRITQLVTVGGLALGLGYFLGHQNLTRPSESDVAKNSAGSEWNLSSRTDQERKNKCLESLGAYSVPLLDAPEIDSKIPRPFKTNFEGEVYLKWNAIPKAKQYIIFVEDAAGTTIKSYKASTTFTYLKGLPRSQKADLQLSIRLATQNLNELIGPPGHKYELIVKRPLDLTAPKIEEIKIED